MKKIFLSPIFLSVIFAFIATFASLAYKAEKETPTIMGKIPHWGWPFSFIRDNTTTESVMGKITTYDGLILQNFFLNLIVYGVVFYLFIKIPKVIRVHYIT